MMTTLKEIRADRDLVNDIDWDMTPEEAVTLYLEWGNNWSHGKRMVKSKSDVSHYFVVNTWEDPPALYLIRRNSEEARDLAKMEIPSSLRDRFMEEIGHNKGVYALSHDLRDWLQESLGAFRG